MITGIFDTGEDFAIVMVCDSEQVNSKSCGLNDEFVSNFVLEINGTWSKDEVIKF